MNNLNLNLNNKKFFEKRKSELNKPNSVSEYREKCYPQMERKMTHKMDRKYVRKMTTDEESDYLYKMFIYERLNFELFDKEGMVKQKKYNSIIPTNLPNLAEVDDLIQELSRFNSRQEYLQYIQNRNRLDADTMEYVTYLGNSEYGLDFKDSRILFNYISGDIKFDNEQLQSIIKTRKELNKDEKYNQYEYYKKIIIDVITSYEEIYHIFTDDYVELEQLVNTNFWAPTDTEFIELMQRYKSKLMAKNNSTLTYICFILDKPEHRKIVITFKNTLGNYDKFMALLKKNENITYKEQGIFTHNSDIILKDYIYELFEESSIGDSLLLKFEKLIVKKLIQENKKNTILRSNRNTQNCYKELNFSEFMDMLNDIGETRRSFEEYTNTTSKNIETFGTFREPSPFYVTPIDTYTLSHILCKSINCYNSSSVSGAGLWYTALSDNYKYVEEKPNLTFNEYYQEIQKNFESNKSTFKYKNRDYLFNSLYNTPNCSKSISQTNSVCTAFRGIGSDNVIYYKFKTLYSVNHNKQVLIHSYRDKDFIIHILRVYNTMINSPNNEEHTSKLIFLFYYLFCNWMPYKRGSAAIGKFLLRYFLNKKGFRYMKENTSNTLTDFIIPPLPNLYTDNLTMRVFSQFPYNYKKGNIGIGTLNYRENEICGVTLRPYRDSYYGYYTNFGIETSDKFKNFSANADVIAILLDDFELFYKLMLERFYIPNVIHIKSTSDESNLIGRNTTAMKNNI